MSQHEGTGLRPITEVAADLKIDADHLEPYGRDKAKVRLEALHRAEASRPRGRLILVSAITPTPAGEGKTTTSIGLAQGLHRIGKNAVLALRQPSMGPVFGRKGGATGGGASRVEPSNTINLQFTGDFHAITAAHNLLAAAIDNRLHFGEVDLDSTRVLWKRALDMNDRALRNIVIGLGGQRAGRAPRVGLRHHGRQRGHGHPLPGRLAGRPPRPDRPHPRRLHDPGPAGARRRNRRDRLDGGHPERGDPAQPRADDRVDPRVHPRRTVRQHRPRLQFDPRHPDGDGHGRLRRHRGRVRLRLRRREVLRPQMPHGGPQPGRDRPRGHGPGTQDARRGRARRAQGIEPGAVERGLENLAAHLDSAAHFGKPTVVAINRFGTDTAEELEVVHAYCAGRGVPCATADVFGSGGRGAIELAEKVVAAAAQPETPLQPLYPLDWAAERKIERIARIMYGADGVSILPAAAAKLRKAARLGYGELPICMAKTQDSLSDNPKLRGRPRGFTLTVRDVEIAAGAGFLVALTGDIVRMPGLPHAPPPNVSTSTPKGGSSGWPERL